MQQLQQNYEPGKELDIASNLVPGSDDNSVTEHEGGCNEECENDGCNNSGECKLLASRYKIM